MRNPDPREGRGDLFGHYLTSRLVEAGVDPFLLFDASVEAIMDLAAAAAEQSDTLDWVPQPLGDAHYAAFPPFIPEFCLKAATAEVCCGACGAPYAPVVERINLGVTDRNVNNTRYTAGSESLNNTNGLENSTLRHELIRAVRRDKGLPGRSELGHDRSFPGGFSPKGHAAELWLPTCPCDPETAGTQPAVALDMFAGSGTTLQEAERLGRASIGIELAEVYQKIARRRLQRTHYGKDRLLPGQASLFDAPEEKEPRHPALPFAGPDEGRI